MGRIVAAPNKFRGSATAREVAEAVAEAAEAAGYECLRLPLADGEEGTLDALGGANRSATVTGRSDARSTPGGGSPGPAWTWTRFPARAPPAGWPAGWPATGARLVSGFNAIADLVGVDEALAGAGLVVTGEGRLDETSRAGKVVGGVLRRAAAAGIPVLVIAGSVEDDLAVPSGVTVVDLTRRFGGDRSWPDPRGCIRDAVAEKLR